MKLINTDGMAFIGPGSEWFWTAISGLVLAITFVAIFRQLRLQRGAGAIEQMASLQRDWDGERMARSRLTVMLALQENADLTDFPVAWGVVGDFWEAIGYLVRAGHVDRHLVNEYFFNNIRLWWLWARTFDADRAPVAGEPGYLRTLRVARQTDGRDGPLSGQNDDLRRRVRRPPGPEPDRDLS